MLITRLIRSVCLKTDAPCVLVVCLLLLLPSPPLIGVESNSDSDSKTKSKLESRHSIAVCAIGVSLDIGRTLIAYRVLQPPSQQEAVAIEVLARSSTDRAFA